MGHLGSPSKRQQVENDQYPVSRSTALKNAGPWLVVLALFALPAFGVVLLVLSIETTPSELLIHSEPVLAEPTLRVREGRTDAYLALELGATPLLLAGQQSGVVTSVHARQGDALRSGDLVFSIDLVEIRAIAADAPFHRMLSIGSRGPDVEQLERFLIDQGHFAAQPDNIFDRDTAVAVRLYEESIGVERPTGIFDPGVVLWIPSEPFHVRNLLVRPGQPAPGLGQVVTEGVARVLSAGLIGVDGAGLTLEEPMVLEFEGRAIGTVHHDALPDHVVLEILSSNPVDPGVADGEVRLPVALRLETPLEVLVVASSAVMVDAGGQRTCVWVTLDSGGFEPAPVTVVGGTLGVTDILGEIRGRRVLVNPLEILQSASCP